MNRREFIVGVGATVGFMVAPFYGTHTGSNWFVSPSHVASHWPNAHEWAMLNDINAYRVAKGRRRLEMSRSLAAAARHHAYYMSRTDDVDHSLGGVSWAQNIYNYGYPTGGAMGENVAAGRSSSGGILNLWIGSEGHNEVLLDPKYIRLGVGRVYYGAGRYDYYWVATFGSISHRTIYQ